MNTPNDKSNGFRQGYIDDLRKSRNSAATLKDDFYTATVFDAEICKKVGDCCLEAERQYLKAINIVTG